LSETAWDRLAAGQVIGEPAPFFPRKVLSAEKLSREDAKERKFEDVVKSAEQAAVLVLVY